MRTRLLPARWSAAFGLILALLATSCLDTAPQGHPAGAGPEGAGPPPGGQAGPPPGGQAGPPPGGQGGPPPDGQGGPPPGDAAPGQQAPPSEPPHQLSMTEIEEFLARGIAAGDLEAKIAHGVEVGAVTLPIQGTDEQKASLIEKGVPASLIEKWSVAPASAPAAPASAPAAPDLPGQGG